MKGMATLNYLSNVGIISRVSHDTWDPQRGLRSFSLATGALSRGPKGARLAKLPKGREHDGRVLLHPGEIVRLQTIPEQGSAERRRPVGQGHDGLG